MNLTDNPNKAIGEEQQPGAFEGSPESGETGTSAEAWNDVRSRALPAHGLSDRLRPTSLNGGSEHSRIDGEGVNVARCSRTLRRACRWARSHKASRKPSLLDQCSKRKGRCVM